LLVQQRGQQAAGQQARGAGVEAEENLVELLALRHPQHAPGPRQHQQAQHRAPQRAARRKTRQHHQERWPDQIEVLFHRQRPHVQQCVGTVEEGDAVVGQVQQGHQRVGIHVREVRPQQRREHAVRPQEQRQRGHQAEEAAAVKTPVVQPAVALQFLQQQ